MLKDLLQVWRIVKPFQKLLSLFFVLRITISGMDMFHSVMMGSVLAALVASDIERFQYLVLIVCAYSLIYYTIDYILDYQEEKRIKHKLSQHVREFSLKKLFTFNISQTVDNNSAIRQDIVNKGEYAIERIMKVISSIIYVVFSLLISFCIIFYTNIIAGGYLLICAIIIFVWGMKFNKFYAPIRESIHDMWISQSKIKQEAYTHLQMIKSMGQDIKFLLMYIKDRGNKADFAIEKGLISERHDGRRNYFSGVVSSLGVFLFGWLFLNHKIDVAGLYIVFFQSWTVIHYTRSLYSYLEELFSDHVQISKYLNFVNLKPDFDENGDNLPFKNGDIEFKNFSFIYPNKNSIVKEQLVETEITQEQDESIKGQDKFRQEQVEEQDEFVQEQQNIENISKSDHIISTYNTTPALQNINFTIKENSKVAFVGHSGSGKSTIVKLLLKYYHYDDTNGARISINGVDLKNINARDLRQNIGYVEQHVELFDSTLKENILFGLQDEEIQKLNETQILDKLEEISQLAKIDAFYDRLGNTKFETLLGEKGIKLSGGERQRVGIARAIIRNPKILIFDEATASLDTINENYIKDAVQQVSHGRTTIIIAHRLSTVMNSDKIFVLEKGKIVGEGTHKELLETNKYYQDLISGQELA